jgi:hypothetical protein
MGDDGGEGDFFFINPPKADTKVEIYFNLK